MSGFIDVSYSSLKSFRTCPMLHTLQYKDRWSKPIPEDSGRHKGTDWHAVLEAHYNSLMATQDDFTVTIDERQLLAAEAASEVILGFPAERQELMSWMYTGYVAQYGVDEAWRILAVEQKFVVPMITDRGHRSSRFRLKMRIDLVVQDRFTRTIRIVDHKSAGQLERKQDTDLADQFGLYTWGLRQLGHKVQMSVYSGALTRKNKVKEQALADRFRRTAMFRTDQELFNLAVDAWRAAKAAHAPGIPYSSPTPDRCGWGCDFRDAHLMMRKGVGTPVQILTDFGFSRSDERH